MRLWACFTSGSVCRAVHILWTSPPSTHERTLLQRTMATSTKKALRAEIKSKLAALNEDKVEKQSQIAQDTLLSLQQYQDASRISIYLSMPSGEVRTDRIVRDALAKGKTVFIPYIYSLPASGATESKPRNKKMMTMLSLTSAVEFAGLKRDSWGIPYLPTQSIEERENATGGRGISGSSGAEEASGLDLVVIPGVAFDRDMNRIGHGAGFYDRFLTQFCENGKRQKPYLGGF